jgi:hypothetical protein
MFQVIENWSKRKVIDSISVDTLVSMVRNPSKDYLDKVSEIRKYPRKSKEYDEIKKTLPCFTTAFNFRGYISNKNVGKSTGYLYLDIDDVDSINLEHPSIVFYCKSISNKGYSIIVGVIGVTPDNIQNVTRSVAQELDIKLDEAAISKDRLTIISYDINAYYNPEHTYFLYEKGILKNPHYNTIHNIYISNDCSGGKIRKDNFDDVIKNIDFNGELLKDFGSEKIGYIKLITPFKEITDGHRNTTMNKICYIMKGLNPDTNKDVVYSYLQSINIAKFSPPLMDSEINNIIDSVFRIENIELYPNTFRRFIYNPDYNLSTKDKRGQNIKILNNDRKESTKKDIEYFIDSWDFRNIGKITQTKLIAISGKNKKTIEKYYPEFKAKIIKLNLHNLK